MGELIGEGQYEVYATHGKGVFSSVLRARDLTARDRDTGEVPEVAIKVGGESGVAGCLRVVAGLV